MKHEVTERMYVTHEGDRRLLVIDRQQDVTPFIEASKRALAEETHARPFRNPGEKSYHVAHIPNIVVEQWLKEGLNIHDPDPATQKKLRQRLNSPEWRYLRTYPGRI
jgi:hypothetical protein